MSLTTVTNPTHLITLQPRKVYMYVPQSEIGSIRKYGYLSVCAQRHQFGKLSQSVIDKYTDQMKEASGKYGDLNALLMNKSIDQQVISYLDWRMEEDIPSDKRGSCAIYVLYYPIPNEPDIVDYVENVRHFATDRVLLSTTTNEPLYPIPSDTHILPEHAASRQYWVAKWREQMCIDAENPLWLQGIPHAYFFPKDGMIPFDQMNVEKFLFI
mgnify:CR=1 FL=1